MLLLNVADSENTVLDVDWCNFGTTGYIIEVNISASLRNWNGESFLQMI